MKLSNQTWAEYIRLGEQLESKKLDELFERLDNLRKRVSPLFDLESSNLLDKNCAKIIVKKENQPFIYKDTGHRYAFFFQCLTTGRFSKVIPIVRLNEFGIIKDETFSGGEYPYRGTVKIENKITDIFSIYFSKVRQYNDLIKEELLELSCNSPSYKQRYYEYLNSPEWQEKRLEILERDGFRCVVTGKRDNLHIHHVSYDNIGQESSIDLVTLCSDAHEIIHDESHQLNEYYIQKVDNYIYSLID